jgi:hypothetical protein
MKCYLMWCGNEFYASTDEWSEEAVKMGVSKRVGNVAIAKKMMDENTVVLVAHNDGATVDCGRCLGRIECPACRKLNTEADRLRKQLLQLEENTLDALKPKAGYQRSVRIRTERLNEIEGERLACECKGKGFLKRRGTGGKVELVSGEVWDYRRYNYWLHQPETFDAESEVEDKVMCSHCGGTGEVPLGKVFGMFVPSHIEYIVDPGDDEEKLEAMRAAGAKLIPLAKVKKELPRGCGKRKPGGVYVVTKPSKEKAMSFSGDVLESLGGCDLHGDYVRFGTAVAIPGVKKFRGTKSFDVEALGPAVLAEIKMIQEALED